GPGDVLPLHITALPIAFTPATGTAQQIGHVAEHAIVASAPSPVANSSPNHTVVAAALRAKPAGDGEVRIMLSAGTRIDPISKLENDSGTWWFVSSKDLSGWLRADEISSVSP